MNLTAFLALFRKDLRLFFSDRRAVLMSFAAPILIASFFGFLFSGSSKGDAAKVPVSLVDGDGSVVSRKLMASIASDKSLDAKMESLEAARERVRKGKATVALVIPKGFGEEATRAFFRGGKKPQVGLHYDPSHTAELGLVKGLLTQHAMEVVSAEVFNGEAGRGVVKESLSELDTAKGMKAEDRTALKDLLGSLDRYQSRQKEDKPAGGAGPGMTMPFSMLESAVTSGDQVEYNGFAHSFGGMGVQFILFMGIEAGISILLLRQTGLWKRLRSAPLSKATLLGSRAASAAAISMLILAVIFGFARLVFQVRIQGSFLGFLGVCLAFSLMTASYGLLIASLGHTPDAARGLSIFVTLLMVMLGGAWIPAFVFPAWLQKVTLLVPTRWAVDGLDAMTWRGLGLMEALPPIAVLLAFTALFGAVAVWKFRWEEG